MANASVVYGVKYNGVEKISYDYDSLMRRTSTTINTTVPFTTNYGYKSVGNNTSTQLASIWYSNSDAFNYTYDANGNITAITHPAGYELVHYHYDALNQLVREDNYELNKTITYTYDNGGNIRSVKEYAYTTGALGSVVKQKTYTYGDSEWKDLLTNYNGVNISYDAIGNPRNWINGENFTWVDGRRLATVTKGSNTINYAYNEDGIRTSKTINGIRTDYYLNGTSIIMQKTGDNCIWYTYDENGLATGFRYNGNEYYYFRNGQNDIIGIIDSSGSTVARYTYDSWGNPVSITDGNGNNVASDSSHIANINPFRYRGYYFDTETGLYYLISRYYDANVGRFINADGYVSTGQGVDGNNMFAYCLNNPINYFDKNGEVPGWIIIIGFIALMGAGGAILGASSDEKLLKNPNEEFITKNNAIKVFNEQTGENINIFDNYDVVEKDEKTNEETKEPLTVCDRVENAIIGGVAGIAAGGLLVATYGAAGVVIAQSATAILPLVGLNGVQTFSWGALAFNAVASIFGPVLGWDVEPIEKNVN